MPAMPAMSPSRLLHLGIAVVAVAAAAAILFCFVALARVVCVSRSSLSGGRAVACVPVGGEGLLGVTGPGGCRWEEITIGIWWETARKPRGYLCYSPASGVLAVLGLGRWTVGRGAGARFPWRLEAGLLEQGHGPWSRRK